MNKFILTEIFSDKTNSGYKDTQKILLSLPVTGWGLRYALSLGLPTKLSDGCPHLWHLLLILLELMLVVSEADETARSRDFMEDRNPAKEFRGTSPQLFGREVDSFKPNEACKPSSVV
jgi:hypothetical protein